MVAVKSSMSTEAGEVPVSMAVVEAVAGAEDVDPLDLATPLADVIDPDALDALFRTRTAHLTFEYGGYRVSIDADRTIEVAALRGA